MHIAVEMKNTTTMFYNIDGRFLNKFIEKVKRDLPEFKSVWTYSSLEKLNGGVGFFKDSKTVLNNQ